MRRPAEEGSGSELPHAVLLSATICSLVATLLSMYTVYLQLKNYRKVRLQRWVVRILVMVPVYAIASCVSLYSTSAAFFVDAVRDIYEAFVIYCFFCLLVEYLGGERSLIISLVGRPAVPHSFPVNLCLPPLDISDPFSFLNVKRGILQYVQIKPILAVITMVLKALGKYSEGTLQSDNGYTYISIVYNLSVCVSLYCLVIFWTVTHHDLKPYRPLPKFICVKGLIFATFWQGFLISILVSAGALHVSGYSKDDLSLALSDALICYEMPAFAIMHLYAFSHLDYVDNNMYAGRMPFRYALCDSLLGYKDVLHDSLVTFKGTGFSYRTFEPSEGGIHHGLARQKRIQAGLRYANGGQTKHWLPMPGAESGAAYRQRYSDEESQPGWQRFMRHPVEETQRILHESRIQANGYAPISPEQAQEVVHRDPADVTQTDRGRRDAWQDYSSMYRPYGSSDAVNDADATLEFGALASDDEELFMDAKRLEFGDYNSPVVDASKEAARRQMREQEEAVIGRSNYGNAPTVAPSRQPQATETNENQPVSNDAQSVECVDLVVEDTEAALQAEENSRLRGDVSKLGGRQRKVYRRVYVPASTSDDKRLQSSAHESAMTVAGHPGKQEEILEFAVERQGISGSGRDEEALPIDDVPLVRESAVPDYVRESGFVGTEHGGDPQAENPWMA